MKVLKSTKWLYIAFCLLLIGTGLCMAIWPTVSMTVMNYIIGALILAFGIIRIVGYFADDYYCIAFQFDLALGIFASVIGIAVLIHPKWIMASLPIAIGLFVLVDGLFSVQSAIDAKKFGIRRWWLILIFSILTVGIGLVMIFNPVRSAKVLAVITGIALIASGVEALIVALQTVKIKKAVKDRSPIEVDYIEIDERKDN
ncbi:MAG: HdeD family acid-resistance protein [Acutalibacteraceae bacterium]